MYGLCLFVVYVCLVMKMSSADESAVILYLSPSLHHLPSQTHIDKSAQLTIESVCRAAVPASSEPSHSYVVSPMMSSAVEDSSGLQTASVSTAVSDNKQLSITTECSIDAIDTSGSGSAENGLVIVSTDQTTDATAVNLNDQYSIGQSNSKVSS